MSDLLSRLWSLWIDLAFSVFPWSKDQIKVWISSHGTGPLWVTARDYVFLPATWLFGIIPCAILERLWPAVEPGEGRRRAYLFDFLYPVFGTLLFIPFAGLTVISARSIFHSYFPFLNLRLLDGHPMPLQVLGAFLIADFSFYVSHVLRHKVPWLWHFHAIHHSQEELNPLTSQRVHFMDVVVDTAIRIAPMAVVGGTAPSWFFYLSLNHFWGYFIHSNVRVNLGRVGRVIVSPQFHRVHHSRLPEHFDRNYGERLVIWDRLFKTAVDDTEVYPPTGIVGFDPRVLETDASRPGMIRSFLAQTWYPFRKIVESIISRMRSSHGG